MKSIIITILTIFIPITLGINAIAKATNGTPTTMQSIVNALDEIGENFDFYGQILEAYEGSGLKNSMNQIETVINKFNSGTWDFTTIIEAIVGIFGAIITSSLFIIYFIGLILINLISTIGIILNLLLPALGTQ